MTNEFDKYVLEDKRIVYREKTWIGTDSVYKRIWEVSLPPVLGRESRREIRIIDNSIGISTGKTIDVKEKGCRPFSEKTREPRLEELEYLFNELKPLREGSGLCLSGYNVAREAAEKILETKAQNSPLAKTLLASFKE